MNVLTGAGGLHSTAADMLAYLEAQLHLDRVKGGRRRRDAHRAQLFRLDDTGIYWHDGATGGFRSFALFDPAKEFAVQRLAGKPARSVGHRE